MAILSRLLIICVGLVAASAHAAKRSPECGKNIDQGKFTITGSAESVDFLRADERNVFDALLWFEGRHIVWDQRLLEAGAKLLADGRAMRATSDADLDFLARRLKANGSDAKSVDAFVSVFRRARGGFALADPIGTDTQLTEARMMIASRRLVLDALIAQSGVRMKWDTRLQTVADYVIEIGLKRDFENDKPGLSVASFDYLTRALLHGPSDPKMVNALMRVLRGPI